MHMDPTEAKLTYLPRRPKLVSPPLNFCAGDDDCSSNLVIKKPELASRRFAARRMMEIRGILKGIDAPRISDAGLSCRPLLVLFIVLFDWHLSYKQKKEKSQRREGPACSRALPVSVFGGI